MWAFLTGLLLGRFGRAGRLHPITWITVLLAIITLLFCPALSLIILIIGFSLRVVVFAVTCVAKLVTPKR